ncbi:MAG: pitrilysin family protein [bacterium]
MRNKTVLCALLLAGCLAALQASSIETVILPNGMKLIHKFNPANDVVSSYVFIPGGGRHEPDGKAGIAVLAQQLAARGTHARTSEKIAFEIESCGGNLSASASEDYLQFFVKTTVDNVEKGFKLLADIVINPTFPEDEFIKEKENQLTRLKTRSEQISTLALDELNKYQFVHHSYGIPLPGTDETVRRISREDVIDWYADQARPAGAILSVVGNIKFKTLQKLITLYFNEWKEPSEPRPIILPVIVEPRSDDISRVLPRDFKQSFIARGYLFPSGLTEDYAALKLINEILGGGLSRRLFQKFREEKPYAYSVDCFYSTKMEKSQFVMYIGLDQQNVDDAQREFSSMILSFQHNPVSIQELEESKTHCIGTYIMRQQSNDNQAWYLGFWELIGRGYAYNQLFPDEISRITVEQIQQAAQTYFNVHPVTITIQGTK